MSGLTYDILEYLAWISLGLVLVILIFVCVAIAIAISSGGHSLAMKWNVIAKRKHWQVIGPGGWTQPNGYSHLVSNQRNGSGKHCTWAR